MGEQMARGALYMPARPRVAQIVPAENRFVIPVAGANFR
jgi:hypothetical protein